MAKKPVMLMILDGFGINKNKEGNAIFSAKTPNMDFLMNMYPTSELKCSGMDVGLPNGQMGNSEVGHTNIGAGRIVYQELTRITKAIEEETFFTNEALLGAMQNVKEHQSKLHIMGLLSDGGVHSHNTHLYALVNMAKIQGIKEVYVHAFMDGRDVPPDSGKDYIAELDAKLKEIGVGKIATVSGRYYAMDRDNRWEREELAYNAMVKGEGVQAESGMQAVSRSYDEGTLDEFILPTVIEGGAKIEEGDSVVFFNFRPDRARQITRMLVDPDFNGFERQYFPVHFVCMTQYDKEMPNVEVAFKPQSLKNTFGEYISEKGLKQLRIAETEKYAHVTFFFNGGVEKVSEGEDRILVPSPKVATYDLKPEMSAVEVCDKVIEQIEAEKYDVIILNFANCDMVGHTGVFEAAVKAVETVDTCVGRIIEALKKVDGIALITADHGNADQMVDPETGGVFTAHTTNPVPLVLFGEDIGLKDGRLADLAPTMLELLGLPIPEEMSGESLLKHS